ncbi:MAG: class I SAM-dependent methyltransferase [Candidatus Promineifilaceae bacterium]|nr:class I SAM-dependent methyltransferase [Candidatus Promineifilaceae bacterium]
MEEEAREKLLGINKEFYSQFAESFARTRLAPQPGFKRLLEYIPRAPVSVLDVGCGNGRFGMFLQEQMSDIQYTGIDFSENLLKMAATNVPGSYYQRDLSQVGFLQDTGSFVVISCLATMQHIPGRRNRSIFLQEIRDHLAKGAVIMLANWQFLESPRQRRKIQPWNLVNLREEEVEANDYLMTWQRDGYALRYVCLIDGQETAELASEAGLTVIKQFRSDGKEGNLNLYTILAAADEGVSSLDG